MVRWLLFRYEGFFLRVTWPMLRALVVVAVDLLLPRHHIVQVYCGAPEKGLLQLTVV